MLSMEEAAQAFAALGAEPRIEVLMALVRLGDRGLSFGQLQEKTGVPASTLAHHLRFLADAGLIVQTRDGRQTISRPSFERLEELSRFFLANCCADLSEIAVAATQGPPQ